MEVPTLLADRGQHRAASIPDLIIAATAEVAGLTVLHLEKDFEIIDSITGQPLERLKPPKRRDCDSAPRGRCGRCAQPMRSASETTIPSGPRT